MVVGALLRRGGGGSSASSFTAVANFTCWAQRWATRRGTFSGHDGTLLLNPRASSSSSCSSSYTTSSIPRSAHASFSSSASSSSWSQQPPPLYTSTHEVLRLESIDSHNGAVTMTVGLTERAFDLIGDVKTIEALVDAGAAVGAGGKIMNLHWEGFRRTASDELYHAIWANVSDYRGLSLPFAASVVDVNGRAMADPYKTVTAGEGGWVVKVTASRAALEAAGGELMNAEQYRVMCEREEEEEDAAASRSYP